jgi:hypothetical protein
MLDANVLIALLNFLVWLFALFAFVVVLSSFFVNQCRHFMFPQF